MSYKKTFPRKDRVAARFLAQVHAAIAQAAMTAKSQNGLTQLQVAQELGVDKSVVSRILKGAGNPTIRTIGELSAALGYRPELVLHKVDAKPGSNAFRVASDAGRVVVTSKTTATGSHAKRGRMFYSAEANLVRADQ